MNPALRLYTFEECGPTGYPVAWERGTPVAGSENDLPRIPAIVRAEAGHRCVRCGHPYLEGQSNPMWSPCDERCTHRGPTRCGAYGPIEVTPEHRAACSAPHEAAYRVLTVHHLTGEKRDCRWWNLVALCQRCHLTIQGKVNMAQLWPHEHSEWFKPYAAGYYAHTYLGQDLDRDEVGERLEELLELERMAA